MVNNKKISKERFQKAIEDTGGILTLVARKLKVSRSTVYEYLKNNAWAWNLVNDEREKIIDLGEASLFFQVKERQPWATKFLLTTIGKSRGYVEKQEVEHSGNILQGNVDFVFITDDGTKTKNKK